MKTQFVVLLCVACFAAGIVLTWVAEVAPAREAANQAEAEEAERAEIVLANLMQVENHMPLSFPATSNQKSALFYLNEARAELAASER